MLAALHSRPGALILEQVNYWGMDGSVIFERATENIICIINKCNYWRLYCRHNILTYMTWPLIWAEDAKWLWAPVCRTVGGVASEFGQRRSHYVWAGRSCGCRQSKHAKLLLRSVYLRRDWVGFCCIFPSINWMELLEGPALSLAIADMAAIMCHVLQAESYSWPQANMRSGFNMQALHIVWSMDELWLQLLSS